ncbi:MAG: glycoside hydrolase family 13 protein [Chlorobi bacterium]|nr:glycoside hydrolase family 13 protein [Chlorobiota bacterium]
MKKTLFLIFIFTGLLLFTMCTKQKNESFNRPPLWAKHVIWYQIFPERFNNGDSTNDPRPENISSASNFRPVPADWSVTPWTHNWYEQEKWAKNMGVDFYSGLQLRRFGGDLQGIIDKLDYLRDLGITAIYLNPINDAPSLHKYDARNYRHVDVNFGPDPQGDNRIMASEIPDDPSTWKWTSADKLFLKLVDEVHKRNMKIILDYSWNHTGVEFWAWKDIVKNQEKSKYKDWYDIEKFDNPKTAKNEFEYKGWLNIKSLPELKKINTPKHHKPGRPFEGDINPGAKKHIFAVTKRWLAPGGDVSKGIDGYRLDVADHIPMGFWRDYRKLVKSINPEAYLVGEIWWEKWPDKLMNPVPYVSGDVFDAVMFYQLYRPARYFFGKMNDSIDARQFKDSLEFQWSRLKPPFRYGMMNVSATHDTPRLLTSFANPTKYKYKAKPSENPEYFTGKPDNETYRRVRLYLIHQFTNIGAPHIWNGDEMGMWGADDPDCRKPLRWPGYDFEPEYRNNIRPGKKEYDQPGFDRSHFDFYKKLISIRKENPVLSEGEIRFIAAEGKRLQYERYDGKNLIVVLFNLEKTPQIFLLSGGGKYTNLLDGSVLQGKNVVVQPLEAKILKKLSK